jgi:HlyD family secretion protein
VIGWTKVGVLIGAPAAIGLLFLRGGGSQEEDSALPLHEVSRGSVESAVTSLGELETAVATAISSPLRGNSGRILWIAANGSAVVEGQTVLRFDASEFEDGVAKAEQALREAEGAVELQRRAVEWERLQAERDLESAEFELGGARLDLQRVVDGDGPLELSKLESEHDELRSQVQMLRSYSEALAELHRDGYISEAEVLEARRQIEDVEKKADAARRAYETYREHVLPSQIEKARASVRRAESTLERTRRATAIQIARAQSEHDRAVVALEQRGGELARAREQLAKTTVRSPTAGIVVLREQFRDGKQRWSQVGDAAFEGQPLLDIPDLSTMTVRLRLREEELHLVEVGSAALVRVSAFPDLVLSGRVGSIGAMAERSEGGLAASRTFDAAISIDDPPSRLRPGMTATVEIRGPSVVDAVVVPLAAVHADEDGWHCFVFEGGEARRRAVVPGLLGRTTVEVQDGLRPGERVSLVAPTSGTGSR